MSVQTVVELYTCYSRTQPRSQSGMGLGLAIANLIVPNSCIPRVYPLETWM
jgi:hypothetical protein